MLYPCCVMSRLWQIQINLTKWFSYLVSNDYSSVLFVLQVVMRVLF